MINRLRAVFQNFSNSGQLAAADGKRFFYVEHAGAPCGIVFIFFIIQTNQTIQGMAEHQGVSVNTDDFFPSNSSQYTKVFGSS